METAGGAMPVVFRKVLTTKMIGRTDVPEYVGSLQASNCVSSSEPLEILRRWGGRVVLVAKVPAAMRGLREILIGPCRRGWWGEHDVISMRLFVSSFSVDDAPGHHLRLKHRPSAVMCVALAGLLLPGLLSLFTLMWQGVVVALVFGLPAFWLGVLVWDQWQDVCFPPYGGEIRWRDGWKRGQLCGNRVQAASVELNVQPALHKGAGPTAYIRFWVADKAAVRAANKDPWQRVFTYVPDLAEAPVMESMKRYEDALRELGYPAETSSEQVAPRV